MSEIAIVVHACGFSSKEEICPVFKSRLMMAKAELESLDKKDLAETIIIITGGVPFEKGSKILALCGGEYFASLFENNQSPVPVFYPGECFNSSTDTAGALFIAMCAGISKKYIVVSSFWHNWILKQTYASWTGKIGYIPPISFISPNKDMAGYKTIITYASFAITMATLTVIGLNAWFYYFLYEKQIKRTDGFPVLGCD